MRRAIYAVLLLSACTEKLDTMQRVDGPQVSEPPLATGERKCGNGVVDPEETCDGDCAPVCDDGDACTQNVQIGAQATCNLQCTFRPIKVCRLEADGCCPEGCDANNDRDCEPGCGNAIIEDPEICDGNCPTACPQATGCTVIGIVGDAAECSATCEIIGAVAACTHGDGCCPSGCGSLLDNDCQPECGNGVLDVGETCDGNCASFCNDGNACTKDVPTGNASTCSIQCSNTPVVMCKHGDGCCPGGCDSNNDNDCGAVCGNNIVEGAETCDGNCPRSCQAAAGCDATVLAGSARQCDAECVSSVVTSCISGDGCCAPGCSYDTDRDCPIRCGNGVIEGSERCDGNCASTCDDGNVCTQDARTGDVAHCNVVCSNTPVSACMNGDGCCPLGCEGRDGDCAPLCTTDTTVSNRITTCVDGDQCCPATCTSRTDDECAPKCGNGVVESPTEVCDGNCPTACTKPNSCTDMRLDNAGTCKATCTALPIILCKNADGCCPAGCSVSTDSDCKGCGDGIVQAPESCDLGAGNSDAYGSTCTTSCKAGARCGDGVKNGPEFCDLGGSNSNAYGSQCNTTCTAKGPYCGDLVKNGTEVCDGTKNALGESCKSTCDGYGTVCGDGIKAATEFCDLGVSNSDLYGQPCTTSCKAGARCGDGIKNGPEVCDGTNNALGESCKSTCDGYVTVCGDGIKAGTEACDLGLSNSDTYGQPCTTSCKAGARCGDGIKNGPELCDGTKNAAGESCKSTCDGYVTVCGDGIKAASEFCDLGGSNANTYGSQCNTTCTAKGPHCGDNIKNGSEVCDAGAANADTYGARCDTTCNTGDYCGDGRINGPEQCDDANSVNGDFCTSTCTTTTCAQGIMWSTEFGATGVTVDVLTPLYATGFNQFEPSKGWKLDGEAAGLTASFRLRFTTPRYSPQGTLTLGINNFKSAESTVTSTTVRSGNFILGLDITATSRQDPGGNRTRYGYFIQELTVVCR